MPVTRSRYFEPFWNHESLNSKNIFWNVDWNAISIEIKLISQLKTEMTSGVKTYSQKSISGRSTEFDFLPCFHHMLSVEKIPDFDQFELSLLIRPSLFWKLVSLLIRTSWIRIRVQNRWTQVSVLFWFFYMMLLMEKWHP